MPAKKARIEIAFKDESAAQASSVGSDSDSDIVEVQTWDEWTFPFGKYKGQLLSTVVEGKRGLSYCKWLLTNSDGEYPATDKFLREAVNSVATTAKKAQKSYTQNPKGDEGPDLQSPDVEPAQVSCPPKKKRHRKPKVRSRSKSPAQE